MASEVSDRTFCGDIVRHMETEPGNPTNFFQNDGKEAHKYPVEQWQNKFMK
jgi:hypothetical protein